MRITFVTLFPEMIFPTISHSILGRASAAGIASFEAVNPRDFATDVHKTVDARPFGGGPGMLLQCEQLTAALESLTTEGSRRIAFFEPTGALFTQSDAHRLSNFDHLVLVCGHYEGIDQRVIDTWATDIFSIGDFILTGGELPALVCADAVVRTLPRALGDPDSLVADSHFDGLLSAPQYTRPRSFRGVEVPDVLVSGDHGAVDKWRRAHQLRTTRANRPDLFCRAPLSSDDLKLL